MTSSHGQILNMAVKKIVKQIAKRHRWPIWFCYNDKREGWRRLSYCRNGFRASKRVKQGILKDVVALLKEHKIEGEVYWIESFRHPYGHYDKLCIRIPL